MKLNFQLIEMSKQIVTTVLYHHLKFCQDCPTYGYLIL
ncbi:hypothetical protein X975_12049, partial [Stegodyphus mimosarum]